MLDPSDEAEQLLDIYFDKYGSIPDGTYNDLWQQAHPGETMTNLDTLHENPVVARQQVGQVLRAIFEKTADEETVTAIKNLFKIQ